MNDQNNKHKLRNISIFNASDPNINFIHVSCILGLIIINTSRKKKFTLHTSFVNKYISHSVLISFVAIL